MIWIILFLRCVSLLLLLLIRVIIITQVICVWCGLVVGFACNARQAWCVHLFEVMCRLRTWLEVYRSQRTALKSSIVEGGLSLSSVIAVWCRKGSKNLVIIIIPVSKLNKWLVRKYIHTHTKKSIFPIASHIYQVISRYYMEQVQQHKKKGSRKKKTRIIIITINACVQLFIFYQTETWMHFL